MRSTFAAAATRRVLWVTAQMAIKDGALYQYNDHPAENRRVEEKAGE
jgi:hypothetical protein